MSSDAAWTPPNDRTGLPQCEPHHLLFADCTRVRRRALPDPAQDYAHREPTARREIADSSLYAPREFDISPHFMVVKPTLATIKTCIGLIFFGFTPQRIERVHDSEPGSPSGLPLSVPA
jgi:hypothetical protein